MEPRPLNPPEENNYKDLSEKYEKAKELVGMAQWKLERINENNYYYSIAGEAKRSKHRIYSLKVLDRCKRIAGKVMDEYFEEEKRMGW